MWNEKVGWPFRPKCSGSRQPPLQLGRKPVDQELLAWWCSWPLMLLEWLGLQLAWWCSWPLMLLA
jgi:hypothetical protein